VRRDLVVISIACSISLFVVNAISRSGVPVGICPFLFFREEASENATEEAHDGDLCFVKGLCWVSGLWRGKVCGGASVFDVVDVVDWEFELRRAKCVFGQSVEVESSLHCVC
jgi:hypothetical protein